MRQAISMVIGIFLFIGGYALANESSCETSPLVKGKCFIVTGKLYTYNGWPPFLRVESKQKKLYGVGPEENEIVPESIRQVLPTEVEGQFKFCPFGETMSVPYDKRKIQMGCIQSVRSAWYYDRETGERKKLK